MFEALEERALTVANESYELPAPFFTLATQSLGDIEGTFPVPETQLDRFFFKLTLPTPTGSELETVLQRATEAQAAPVKRILDGKRIVAMSQLARRVAVPPDVLSGVASLVTATHPSAAAAPESTRRFVLRGASPRAGQAMILAAKVLAAGVFTTWIPAVWLAGVAAYFLLLAAKCIMQTRMPIPVTTQASQRSFLVQSTSKAALQPILASITNPTSSRSNNPTA